MLEFNDPLNFKAIKRSLVNNGLSYLKQVLVDSVADYGDWLSENLSWSAGEVYTVLPDNIDESRLYQFRWSIVDQDRDGKIIVKKLFYRQAMAFLFKEMQQSGAKSMLLDDTFRGNIERDPTSSSLTSLLVCNEEAFAVADLSFIDERNILDVLLSVTSWRLWGLCIDKQLSDLQKNPEKICFDAKEIKLVFAEAYDGESYVYWIRTENQ